MDGQMGEQARPVMQSVRMVRFNTW